MQDVAFKNTKFFIFPESDEQMFDYYESILLKVMIVSRLLTQVLVQFFSVSFKINNG